MNAFVARSEPPDLHTASLRQMLELLRVALNAHGDAHGPRAERVSAPGDIRVLQSLRDVICVLDGADLRGPAERPSVAAMLGGAEGLERLRATLSALQPSWMALVRSKLQAGEIQRLRALLEAPGPDLLELVNRADDENSHSQTLRWLLDPRTAPSIAPGALVRLTENLPEPHKWRDAIAAAAAGGFLSVRREYVIGAEWADFDLDRIDIVVSGANFILAIENKLWSTEHDEQTVTYWKWLQELPGLKAGIYLTPSGMPAACSEFRAVSYLELLGCLLAGASEGATNATERIVLSAYVKTLARWVLRAELRAVAERGEST